MQRCTFLTCNFVHLGLAKNTGEVCLDGTNGLVSAPVKNAGKVNLRSCIADYPVSSVFWTNEPIESI